MNNILKFEAFVNESESSSNMSTKELNNSIVRNNYTEVFFTDFTMEKVRNRINKSSAKYYEYYTSKKCNVKFEFFSAKQHAEVIMNFLFRDELDESKFTIVELKNSYFSYKFTDISTKLVSNIYIEKITSGSIKVAVMNFEY